MVIFKNCFIVSFILVISCFNLYAALPQEKTDISEENKAKLEKAEKLNSEADILNDEAEKYYKEIEEVDLGGASAFDSKIEKKVNKLKDKAFDKQIEALEIQKDANKLEYDVYKDLVLNYLNTANSDDKNIVDLKLLEEQANEFFYRAEMLQSNAYDDKKNLENVYKKLSEAQEFEKLGLSKENQAYKLTLSEEIKQSADDIVIVKEETPVVEENINKDLVVSSTIPDTKTLIISSETYPENNTVQEEENIKNLKIDEKLLKDYLDYLSLSNKVEAASVISSLNELGNFNTETLRKAWYEYLYESDAIPNEIKTALADSVSNIEAKLLAEKTKKEEQLQVEEQLAVKEETETPEKIVDNTVIDRDLLYKIEIATDNQHISQGALQKIYNGEKVVNIINEGGWQKYSISAFNTYDDADKFRKGIPVKDAFIVSYKKEEERNELADVIPEVKEENKTEELSNTKEEYAVVSDLVYKVQIAASKTPIPDRFLGQIYAGSQDINLIVENGWYKYSIGSYKEYNSALDSRKSIAVNGAFVVAYRNGEKISLDVARGKSVPMYGKTRVEIGEFPITDKLIYKVQIVASRNELSKDAISKIYSGNAKVHVIQEEGWYKYSIGEYDDIGMASNNRKQCGIDGAFVVSYKNGAKVNLLKANNSFEPKLIYDWPNIGNSIVFKVQIAASIEKLAISELKNIYCLNENIFVIKEGVWYKYSIGNYTSFSDASRIRRKTCVKGAFVVAYKNKQKLSINQAIGK